MTVEQIQHLLCYLGYDPGTVDGQMGAKTMEAVKAFQRDSDGLAVDGDPGAATQQALKHAVAYGIEKTVAEESSTGAENATTTGTFWDEIQYFTREEFRCPCGNCGGFPVEPQETLVRLANQMRMDFGRAVIIVPPDGHSGGSGVRCQAYNDSLSGSVTNSRHVQGKAIDFQCPGKSQSEVEAYLARLQAAGKIRYWYRISSGSWHMDIL